MLTLNINHLTENKCVAQEYKQMWFLKDGQQNYYSRIYLLNNPLVWKCVAVKHGLHGWFWKLMELLLYCVLEYALGSCCDVLDRKGWLMAMLGSTEWSVDGIWYERHLSVTSPRHRPMSRRSKEYWILVPWLDKPIQPPTQRLLLHASGNAIYPGVIG